LDGVRQGDSLRPFEVTFFVGWPADERPTYGGMKDLLGKGG